VTHVQSERKQTLRHLEVHNASKQCLRSMPLPILRFAEFVVLFLHPCMAMCALVTLCLPPIRHATLQKRIDKDDVLGTE
jgi:hypothetical protein